MIMPTPDPKKGQKLVTFTSEKGSILAGDTRCWYRGKPPIDKKER